MAEQHNVPWMEPPWRLGDLDKNGQRVVLNSEGLEICTCWHHCVGAIEKHMEANARLITSAPDLAKSLAELIRYCEAVRLSAGMGPNQFKRLENAKAVLARSRGETA